MGRENVTDATPQIRFYVGAFPQAPRLELAVHLAPILAVSTLLLSATAFAAAANSMRIAETGASLLGSAHRCGVTDHRVVRAGRLIRELIAAASDDSREQLAAKSRFAEIFRAAARREGDGRTTIQSCKAVLKQFERLERFQDRTAAMQ
jgi:hypothetical protein